MQRDIKDIKKDIGAIRRMTDAEGRLGFELVELDFDDPFYNYSESGAGLLGMISKHPDKLDLIEEVVIAITGWSFASIKEHMKEHKPHWDSL